MARRDLTAHDLALWEHENSPRSDIAQLDGWLARVVAAKSLRKVGIGSSTSQGNVVQAARMSFPKPT